MSFRDIVPTLGADAEQLELTYQAALAAGEADTFAEAIVASHAAAPDNLLYAAWFYRLAYAATRVKGFAVAWVWVVPLALLNGLLFWWLSDDQRFTIRMTNQLTGATYDFVPTLLLLAAPVSAAIVLVYLTAAGSRRWGPATVIGLGPLAATAYVLWAYPSTGTRPFQEQYLTLMALHLPLLAWAGVGYFLTTGHRDPASRFAFLIRSLEIFVMAGLFVIAGGLFTGITVGLFSALDIDFPVLVQRLFIAGGGGLIPVVATAVLYNPRVSPAAQAFEDGLSQSVALLMRVLLPLTLLVLLVYLGFIPFNFREPFDNRDVLIIYNGMLFAVIALLVGATPLRLADLSPRLQPWLRRGIVAVAALALAISLYALAAILYRTARDRMTPNRLTFIGWNLVNIGLLVLLLVRQARADRTAWVQALYRTFSTGTGAYLAWTVAMILALPWLFGIDQGAVDTLPLSVQRIVYEQAYPILLKCADSPHIYLLDGGEKRWIKDIETFSDRGFVWRDVTFISCPDLRAIADGVPIPADAGPPPLP